MSMHELQQQHIQFQQQEYMQVQNHVQQQQPQQQNQQQQQQQQQQIPPNYFQQFPPHPSMMMMPPPNQEDMDMRIKQKRRTRHDPINRDFQCGCGKSYLSYPALYTHLKQKHNGEHPPGTYQQVQIQRSANEFSLQNNISYQEHMYYQLQLQEIQEEICTFLDSLGYPKQVFNETKSLGKQLVESFPVDFFNDESEYDTIFTIIKNLENQSEIINQVIDPETDLKKCDLNRIFAYFLWYLKDHLNIQETLPELCIFVCLYRLALNQLGWKALEVNEDQKEFCVENVGESALLISNEFIVDYLPNYYKTNKNIQENFKIIGEQPEKLKNVVYMVQYFSNWIFVQRYSNAKLLIETEKSNENIEQSILNSNENLNEQQNQNQEIYDQLNSNPELQLQHKQSNEMQKLEMTNNGNILPSLENFSGNNNDNNNDNDNQNENI